MCSLVTADKFLNEYKVLLLHKLKDIYSYMNVVLIMILLSCTASVPVYSCSSLSLRQLEFFQFCTL